MVGEWKPRCRAREAEASASAAAFLIHPKCGIQNRYAYQEHQDSRVRAHTTRAPAVAQISESSHRRPCLASFRLNSRSFSATKAIYLGPCADRSADISAADARSTVTQPCSIVLLNGLANSGSLSSGQKPSQPN